MHITISVTAPDDAAIDQALLNVEVAATMSIADLKAYVQNEYNVAPTSQHIYHNGRLLVDPAMTLETAGVGEGDMLAMHIRSGTGSTPAGSGEAQQAQQAQPATSGGRRTHDSEMIRLRMLGDPRFRAEVRRQNAELADSAEDANRFRSLYDRLQAEQVEVRKARERELAMLNDPFNVEGQQRLEEMIRMEAVQENLQTALEYHPEDFGSVTMLYVDVEVNGRKVKAFVDSGAQSTIMSPSCAEACGIMRLIDRRYAGTARGVGTAAILGRVHSAQIKIGDIFLPCGFTVMEGKDVDLMLGLDMLKRHQACIDLRRNKLVIQDVEVLFLPESEIPKYSEQQMQEPTFEGPAGTRVGAKSGTITQPGTSGSLSSQAQSSGSGTSSNVQPSQGLQQSGPASGAVAGSTTESQGPAQFPAQAIAQLEQFGFSRQEAIAALQLTGGNVDAAAGLLFEG